MNDIGWAMLISHLGLLISIGVIMTALYRGWNRGTESARDELNDLRVQRDRAREDAQAPRCLHDTVPVESVVTGEVLAHLCVKCSAQLDRPITERQSSLASKYGVFP